MIMLKIRKDVSYIIQLFYTTYKEVTVRDVILLIIDILNFKNNLFFPLNCMHFNIRVVYGPNQSLVSFIHILGLRD